MLHGHSCGGIQSLSAITQGGGAPANPVIGVRRVAAQMLAIAHYHRFLREALQAHARPCCSSRVKMFARPSGTDDVDPEPARSNQCCEVGGVGGDDLIIVVRQGCHGCIALTDSARPCVTAEEVFSSMSSSMVTVTLRLLIQPAYLRMQHRTQRGSAPDRTARASRKRPRPGPHNKTAVIPRATMANPARAASKFVPSLTAARTTGVPKPR